MSLTDNTFHVVRILSEFDIIVNAGAKSVSTGDTLEIFVRGDEVVDPITHQDLGTLDFIKAEVIVANVYDKMCLCRSEKNELEDTLGMLASRSVYYTTKRIPLNINSADISPGFSDQDSTIRVGDLVRKSLG